VQPRSMLFNNVETKDLCTVRYSSTSNKGLYFVALKFAGLPDHHMLTDNSIA
jgi:hypothetical protein